MSSTVSTSRAPSRIRRWQPRLERLSTGPGDGEDLAVLLHRVMRRRERAAPRGGLDDDHAQAEAADDPVALGEEAGDRLLPHRRLAEQGAGGGDLVGQRLVLGRIDLRQPVGQDGQGPAPRLQRPAVRGRVDPPRQARDHRQADPGQRARQPLGDPQPVRRALPRADQGDRELVPGLDRPPAYRASRAGRES